MLIMTPDMSRDIGSAEWATLLAQKDLIDAEIARNNGRKLNPHCYVFNLSASSKEACQYIRKIYEKAGWYASLNKKVLYLARELDVEVVWKNNEHPDADGILVLHDDEVRLEYSDTTYRIDRCHFGTAQAPKLTFGDKIILGVKKFQKAPSGEKGHEPKD